MPRSVVCFGSKSTERLRAKLLELVSSSLEAGHSSNLSPSLLLCEQAPQAGSASDPRTAARMNCSDRRRARLVSHTESSAESEYRPVSSSIQAKPRPGPAPWPRDGASHRPSCDTGRARPAPWFHDGIDASHGTPVRACRPRPRSTMASASAETGGMA